LRGSGFGIFRFGADMASIIHLIQTRTMRQFANQNTPATAGLGSALRCAVFALRFCAADFYRYTTNSLFHVEGSTSYQVRFTVGTNRVVACKVTNQH
jgi:hypothetical protein